MTIDHDEIRQWAEARGGQPATVKGTGGEEDAGIIRIDFPGYSEGRLEPISWDEFFEKFDASNLALVYSETTRGQRSNFNKLISRESVDLETGELVQAPRRRRKQGERGKTAAKRGTATARRSTAKKAAAKKATPRRATRKTAAAKGERRAPRSAAAKTARKTTGRTSQAAKKKSTAKRGSSRTSSTRSRK